MSLPTVETILEDKNNNTVYTVVAFRRLTYDEMLTAVRQFYRENHTQRRPKSPGLRLRTWSPSKSTTASIPKTTLETKIKLSRTSNASIRARAITWKQYLRFA
jgi:hypothetical protein